jgi:hypothetical protein
MLNKNLPLPRAFYRLLDLFHLAGMAYADTAALTWLAVSRLYVSNKSRFGSEFSLKELQVEAGWARVTAAGLMPEAALLGRGPSLGFNSSAQEAISIVEELCRELSSAPDSAWNVLPFLFSTDRRYSRGSDFYIAQPIVEMLVDMLKEQSGSVWVPFDSSGQVAITAFRRGYEVHTALVSGQENLTRHLLTCIETGSAMHPRLINEVSRDANGRPTTRADFIIATPPFGYSVREGQWGQWQLGEGSNSPVYDRAEAWTIHHLFNRAKKQLVLFSSQNWLFSMGQERRLREGLIEKSDVHLDAVVTVQSGAISSSNVVAAIASFSHGRSTDPIRMTDVKSESRADTFEHLLERYRPVIFGIEQHPKNSRLIPLNEIRDADYVLLPQRLFRTIEMASVNSIPLGEICDAVRPPTPYRGQEGIDVLELGIPNLRNGEWSPIVGPDSETEKWVTANPSTRHESFLTHDDILLSVKGTLGLARLVSDFYASPDRTDSAHRERAIVSSSCVALRLSKGAIRSGISPKYLLLYLRSEEGQEQIRSLQVGAGMPHISNQSLMSAVRIPIPSHTEHAEVTEAFEMLCKHEAEIHGIQQKMQEITESRWTVNLV